MKNYVQLKAAVVYSGGDLSYVSQPGSVDSILDDSISADSISADNQDTLIQLTEISEILLSLGFEVIQIACNESIATLETSLLKTQPDFVFNLVETLNGSDKLIYLAAALYEMQKLPYSGCDAISLATLSSKLNQKRLLRLACLPTAEFFSQSGPNKLFDVSFEQKSWIVKSDSEHASVGINSDSVVKNTNAAIKKIEQKTNQFGGVWFAEEFVDGREFNLSIIETENGLPRVLPAAEIVFENFPQHLPKIVDYAAKWDSESEVYAATKRSFEFTSNDQVLLTTLEDLCVKCWFLFQLKGAVRVDFRVDKNGQPWILEINANPCLSSDAGFMAAADRAGLTPNDIIKMLLPVNLI